MRSIRTALRFIELVGVLIWLRHETPAQNWGPLEGSVSPTSAVTHEAMMELCETGLGLGMQVPAVSGSAGSTTIGGVSTLEYDVSKLDPNVNYSGYAVCGATGCQIAFDISTWTTDALTPPIDADVLVSFVATAYHELAHTYYATLFSQWCVEHAAACSAFAACIQTLTDSAGNNLEYNAETNNPCAEAYANGTEASRLCQDKLAICDNETLAAADKQALIAELDAEISAAREKCNSQSLDCAICGGPSMPAGFSCTSDCSCS